MQLWTGLQYRLLKKAYPRSPDLLSESNYVEQSKLALLGEGLIGTLQNKTVLDFGCGDGNEAVDMVRKGAKHVIGLDIQANRLETARKQAKEQAVDRQCTFATTTDEPVDIVVSIDAFEHFDDPAAILDTMASLLKPGGEVLFSFGPTWLHPLGGHLFSVFPWSHVLLSEQALLRWRSEFKSDGAKRFSEVAGGLNQMTIARFEKLVQKSRFRLAGLECVPIAKLKPVHTKLTREFTSALCRGRLVLQDGPTLTQ